MITPRAVARVRAAICQAAPIKKTYGTESGWVAHARRWQFARVMALRSALRAEGGAARRIVVVLQQLCGQLCALRRRCAPHVLGSVLQYMTDFMIILCLEEKYFFITLC